MPNGLQSTIANYSAEQRLVKWLCWLSPPVAVALVPVIHRYLLTVLYLQPAAADWDLSAAYRSKVSLAAAAMFPVFIGVWWLGLTLQPRLDRSRLPLAALLSIATVLVCSTPFLNSRLTWFFVEWVIPRTPNPSFARNTLFWEQRNLEHAGSEHPKLRIGLVGSSQTYQGFDLALLASHLPACGFEKNCLAGLGPMQYLFLLERIEERQFDVVVCHLSEFDLFREDVLPDSRLRWGSSFDGCASLLAVLNPAQGWKNRGVLADLTFAAGVPLWRHRDHIRRVVIDYWWKRSDAPKVAAATGYQEVGSAEQLEFQAAVSSLQNNVGRKELVDVNFRCIEQFATRLKEQGTRLIVLEGQMQPKIRPLYDRDGLQQETRLQLSAMADRVGFEYLPQHKLPALTNGDFADPYHLNASGRHKLSMFLTSYLGPRPDASNETRE